MTGTDGSESAGSGLSDAHRATLRVLCDVLIPPDEARGLPGAGQLGLSVALEPTVVSSPELQAGLRALEAEAGADGLASLPPADREACARRVEEAHPLLISSLLFQVFSSYYQVPQVNAALGLGGRPPYPKGYELEQGDLGLLEPVRSRERLYREP